MDAPSGSDVRTGGPPIHGPLSRRLVTGWPQPVEQAERGQGGVVKRIDNHVEVTTISVAAPLRHGGTTTPAPPPNHCVPGGSTRVRLGPG